MDENKTLHHQSEPVLKLKDQSGTTNVYYPIIYEGFPDEFKRITEMELNETDENRKAGLQRLKDIMKRENTACLEDYVLLSLLRNCKFNLKKSEIKLKKFLNKYQEVIKMLSSIDISKVENIIDDFCCGLLPYRDKHGRAIFYTRPYGLNLEKYDMDDLGVVAITLLLFIVQYPITTVAGFIYFGECKSPSFHYYFPIFNAFRKIMFYPLSFPVRFARLELLNVNKLCHWFYKVSSPLFSRKIVSRVYLHEDDAYEKLHKFYDPDILPEEFGGNLGPLNNEAYKQKFLNFVKKLKNESV